MTADAASAAGKPDTQVLNLKGVELELDSFLLVTRLTDKH